MEHRYADAWVSDDGRALRRAGASAILVGLLAALAGLTTLTLARITWSGYAVQAALALGLGVALMGGGWSVLRRGDRLGPTLHPFPLLHRTEPQRSGPQVARVRVRTVPLGALPRRSG